MTTINHLFNRLFNHSTAKKRSLLSAVSGLLGFGIWAYWVNSEHGQLAAIKAALTQGSYSFIVTFLNTYVIECVYRCLVNIRFRLVATATLTSLVVCTLSWCVNTLSGTPEVMMTILPGCAISSIYGFAYTLALKKVTH